MAAINIIELTNLLAEKSEKKEANWNKTSGGNEFSILLDNGSVTIRRFEDRDGININIIISNSNFDEIYNENFDENNSSPEVISSVVNLHRSARNSYFKVEETIDGILKELSKKGSIGKLPEPEEDDLPF